MEEPVFVRSNKMVESWLLLIVVGLIVFLIATIFHLSIKNFKPPVGISANSLLADLDQFYNTHLCSNLSLEFKRTLNRIMIYELHQFKISKQDRSIFIALQIEMLTKRICSSLLVSNSSIMSSIQSFYQIYGSNGIVFDSHLVQQSDNQYLPVPNYLNVANTNGVYNRVGDLIHRLNINITRLAAVLQPFVNSNTFPTINALLPSDYSYIQSTTSDSPLPIEIYVKDFVYSMMYMFDSAFSFPTWTFIYPTLFQTIQMHQMSNYLDTIDQFYNSFNCPNLSLKYRYLLNRMFIYYIVQNTSGFFNTLYQYIRNNTTNFISTFLNSICNSLTVEQIRQKIINFYSYFNIQEFTPDLLSLFFKMSDMYYGVNLSQNLSYFVSSVSNSLNQNFNSGKQCEWILNLVSTLKTLSFYQVNESFLSNLLYTCLQLSQYFSKQRDFLGITFSQFDLFYSFILVLDIDLLLNLETYPHQLSDVSTIVYLKFCAMTEEEQTNQFVQLFCEGGTVYCNTSDKPSICTNNYSLCTSTPRICRGKFYLDSLQSQWGALTYYCTDTRRLFSYKNILNSIYGVDDSKLNQFCEFIVNPDFTTEQKQSIIQTVIKQLKC